MAHGEYNSPPLLPADGFTSLAQVVDACAFGAERFCPCWYRMFGGLSRMQILAAHCLWDVREHKSVAHKCMRAVKNLCLMYTSSCFQCQEWYRLSRIFKSTVGLAISHQNPNMVKNPD